VIEMLATQGYGRNSTIVTQGYAANPVFIAVHISTLYNVDMALASENSAVYDVDIAIMQENQVLYSVSAVFSYNGMIEAFADLVWRVNVQRQRFRTKSKR